MKRSNDWEKARQAFRSAPSTQAANCTPITTHCTVARWQHPAPTMLPMSTACSEHFGAAMYHLPRTSKDTIFKLIARELGDALPARFHLPLPAILDHFP